MNRRIILSAALLLSLVGCRSVGGGHETAHRYAAMEIVRKPVELQESYTASIRGRQDIDIYPQVAGTIVRLCVKEGQRVSKGELLFVIDQVPYQAALRRATADVHATEAQVETARLDYESKQMLLREEVISEYELSTARNALAAAEAAAEQARAQETDARNSLSYTEVRSPSDGTVGTLPFRVGALVGPTMARPLTTVSDNAAMYVYFAMTENRMRSLVRSYGTPEEAIERMPPVALVLDDGTTYEAKGRIETISGIVSEQTGTVQVRAVFPNEKRLLWSGGSGNVVIARIEADALVIPQSATNELQDKIFVYKVVDGKVVATEITVDRLSDGREYIVRSGLEAGEVIVTEGVGMLRDGMEMEIEIGKEAER